VIDKTIEYLTLPMEVPVLGDLFVPPPRGDAAAHIGSRSLVRLTPGATTGCSKDLISPFGGSRVAFVGPPVVQEHHRPAPSWPAEPRGKGTLLDAFLFPLSCD